MRLFLACLGAAKVCARFPGSRFIFYFSRMSIPSLSAKERTMNRAKALVELLLPCLAFAVVVFLPSGFRQARPAPVPSKVTQETSASQGGWLFANTASSSDASVEVTQGLGRIPGKGAGKNLTATTVTTYTVFGTF
jgi:hypothetical protein